MRSKNAVFNIVSELALQVVTIIYGFIIPKMIIMSFGSNVNGLVVSITKFLNYIVLLEVGFGAVVKAILYKPIADKDKDKIQEILKATEKFFRIVACIFVVYIIVLCIVFPMILSNEFDNIFTISLIIIIAISTFIEYFLGMTYKLYIQAEQRTYVISIIQLVTLILNIVLTIVLIYFGMNIQVVKLAATITFVLRPIIQMLYVKKKFGINIKNAKGDYNIKQKWEGLAQHVAYVVFYNTDVAILTLFTNIVEVSVYSVYILVVSSIKNIVMAFTSGIDAIFGNIIAKR